jgi:hypothetical protein
VTKHLCLFYAQDVVEQRVCTSVKIFKIAREKDNPKRIAIAPLNLYFSSMDKHS